jgi:hypothetical protein
VELAIPFLLALFAALFGTALLPTLHFFAFAPFLAIVYQKRSLAYSLWVATGCGLIVGLLTSEAKLSIINFVLITLILHRQKRHFFEDHLGTLPIFTFFISSIFTFLQFILLAIADRNPPFSWQLFFTDILIMPLFDALYAVVWFIGPMKGYQYISKHGFKKLFLKEEM